MCTETISSSYDYYTLYVYKQIDPCGNFFFFFFFFFKLEIIPSEVNAQVKSEFQNFWRDTVLRKLHLKNDISYTKTQ